MYESLNWPALFLTAHINTMFVSFVKHQVSLDAEHFRPAPLLNAFVLSGGHSMSEKEPSLPQPIGGQIEFKVEHDVLLRQVEVVGQQYSERAQPPSDRPYVLSGTQLAPEPTEVVLRFSLITAWDSLTIVSIKNSAAIGSRNR